MNKVILDVYSKIKYITYRRHFLSLSSICRNSKAHDIESTLRKGGTQVAPSLFVFTFTPLLPPPPPGGLPCVRRSSWPQISRRPRSSCHPAPPIWGSGRLQSVCRETQVNH